MIISKLVILKKITYMVTEYVLGNQKYENLYRNSNIKMTENGTDDKFVCEKIITT